MSKEILIRIVGEREFDTHRTRNFAEELSNDLVRAKLGYVDEPDSVTNEIRVKITSNRLAGEVRQIVNSLIKKHLMVDDIEIVKG